MNKHTAHQSGWTDWIKVRRKIRHDGRLKIAANECRVTPTTALGAMITLWCLADEHADPKTGEMIGWSAEAFDTEVGIDGFCKAIPSDWIDISGEWIRLPDYEEHNGSTSKSRATNARRQARHRSKKTKSANRSSSVTHLKEVSDK